MSEFKHPTNLAEVYRQRTGMVYWYNSPNSLWFKADKQGQIWCYPRGQDKWFTLSCDCPGIKEYAEWDKRRNAGGYEEFIAAGPAPGPGCLGHWNDYQELRWERWCPQFITGTPTIDEEVLALFQVTYLERRKDRSL